MRNTVTFTEHVGKTTLTLHAQVVAGMEQGGSQSLERPAPMSTDKESEQVDFKFTAMITLAAHNGGTKYSATVIHADQAGCKKHAAMEFKEGWGKALDQLVALAKKK